MSHRQGFSIDVLSLERFRLDGGAMFGVTPWQLIFEHEPYETSGPVEMFQGKYRLGTA